MHYSNLNSGTTQRNLDKYVSSPHQLITEATQHCDVIHDTQFDYFGKLLATASSDHTIGIYLVKTPKQLARVATLVGHEGPVWMIAWAHPRFGSVLASAGFDKRAIVWKASNTQPSKYFPVHIIDIHRGSVNAVSWASDEYGPLIASSSSDGTVAVTPYLNGHWRKSILISNNVNKIAHAMGATCVSFAPFHTLLSQFILLASGGCDCKVRLWIAHCKAVCDMNGNSKASFCNINNDNNTSFSLFGQFDEHQNWVRDVSFCPANQATRFVLLASCAQDNTVHLYRIPWQQLAIFASENVAPQLVTKDWQRSIVHFDDAIWRLSWAPCGEVLIVTTSTAKVYVLRQGVDFTEPWLKTPLEEMSAHVQRYAE